MMLQGAHGFGGGVMWVFWIVIILLIIWLFGSSHKRQHRRRKENALSLLKKRYAKGEIDQQEYEQIKKDIQ